MLVSLHPIGANQITWASVAIVVNLSGYILGNIIEN